MYANVCKLEFAVVQAHPLPATHSLPKEIHRSRRCKPSTVSITAAIVTVIYLGGVCYLPSPLPPPPPPPPPLLPDFAISDARRTLKRPSIVLLERFAALPAATEKCGLYEAWEVYRRRRRRRRRRCGRGRKCLGVRRVRGG